MRLAWLAANQNADGGWGDTIRSVSNISTAMLARAAFYLAGAAEDYADCLGKARAYLHTHCGQTPDEQAAALKAKAAAHGLTLEDFFRKLVEEEPPPARAPRSPQEAAAHILELQKRVKPDPEGWTIHDYINHGRP